MGALIILLFIIVIGVVGYKIKSNDTNANKAKASNSKTYVKGYEVYKRTKEVKVKGSLIKGNQYSFHTSVKFDDLPGAFGILDVNLTTEI